LGARVPKTEFLRLFALALESAFKDDSETPDDSADQPLAKIRDDLYAAKGVVENTS